jgi:GH25 family lysozyme M1 (1,4-beta-N-acetylmuramidase)
MNTMTVQGIDVSDFQGATPNTNGLSFLFTKATEGTTYVNPEQTAQAEHGRGNGLVVGFYHFLWPGNIAAQAAYFVAKAASQAGDVLGCDWETTEVGTRASSAEKDQFLAEVKSLRPGHKVVLYCNRDFWINHDTSSDCGDGLWIADPNAAPGNPDVKHPWLFHQYSENGGIDHDVANFPTTAALRAWADPASPAPTPAKPVVHLAHVIAAAHTDPGAAQGHTTYKAEVLVVENALVAEGLLDKRWADGSFGTATITAYAALQRRDGYTGTAANGIPGQASLTKLGKAHNFTVA